MAFSCPVSVAETVVTRSYRAAMDHAAALAEMRTCVDWWRPEVLEGFLASVGQG